MSLYEYFVEPILKNGWFNPVNTITYAIILVIAVYFVFRLLKKLKIQIDFKFFLAILPFIFWASSTRVLHDAAFAGVLTGWVGDFYSLPIFPTPGSYLITFLLALVVLLISLVIERLANILKLKRGRWFPHYWKVMFIIGFVLCIFNVYLLPIVTLFPLLIVLLLTGFWVFIFFLISLVLKQNYFKKYGLSALLSLRNQGILASHFLDASATFTALTFFGYVEQHVVPRLVFPFMGPISMFILKAVVVLPVLFVIDRYAEKGNFKNFLLIVVLILGLAPGLRDVIRLVALV